MFLYLCYHSNHQKKTFNFEKLDTKVTATWYQFPIVIGFTPFMQRSLAQSLKNPRLPCLITSRLYPSMVPAEFLSRNYFPAKIFYCTQNTPIINIVLHIDPRREGIVITELELRVISDIDVCRSSIEPLPLLFFYLYTKYRIACDLTKFT